MNIPSWDVMIVAIASVWLVYAMLILRSRVTGALLAAYASYLVAITWGGALFGLLTGQREVFGFSISLHVNEFTINAALFVVLWLLLSTFIGFSKKKKMPEIEIIVHSVFTLLFVTSSVVNFMNEEQIANLGDKSHLAALVGSYHQILLLVPVIFLLYSSMRSHED